MFGLISSNHIKKQADLQQKHQPQKCTLERNSVKTLRKFNGLWHPPFRERNAFPKPSGDQLCSKTQHAKVSVPQRACVPRNVPACLKMSLPAPKL